jgi:3-oxoacyl-[acyl-carrier protein] reductase
VSHDLEAFGLDGRTAVISGASSAMGDAIAELLAAAGASVVLGDVAESGMEETRRRLTGAGRAVRTQRTDVTRRDDLVALVGLAVDAFGGLDVMVNLAGIIHDAEVAEMAEADLDRVLAVNLKGVFFGCQAALGPMQAAGRGSIINMASSGGFTPIPKLAAYAMSKAGVVALTRVLAAEAGPLGVRANAVAPGFVEGGMTTRNARRADGSVDEEKLEATRERTRKRMPLRTTGQPADIANAVLYLASDASRYVTGQVIHANGGAYMP